MTAPLAPRYAVYLTPAPQSALALRGAQWLGYDCHEGAVVTQPPYPELPKHTAKPSRYGFHGTLRAPFELRHDQTPENLVEATARFASNRPHLSLRFSVGRLGSFLALVPHRSESVIALQEALLPAVEFCRAPLTIYDRSRRAASGLTPRQKTLLERWGYPYVLDELRFHLTLTDAIAGEELARVENWADAHFAEAIKEAIQDMGLAVVAQPDRDTPFTTMAFHPLGQ